MHFAKAQLYGIRQPRASSAMVRSRLFARAMQHQIHSILLLSDEGKSWTVSAMKQAHMDESEVVELSDGTVVMFSRNWKNCSAIQSTDLCRQHQDGPCMCTALALGGVYD